VAYCHRRSIIVCLSVCHGREPCFAKRLDVDSGGSKEPLLDRGPYPKREEAYFEGKGAAYWILEILSAVSCAKTAEPIEMPFKIVDSGGPKEEFIRWGPDPHASRGNFEGEEGPAHEMPGHVRRSI